MMKHSVEIYSGFILVRGDFKLTSKSVEMERICG